MAIVVGGALRIAANIKRRKSLFDPCASCSEKSCPSRGKNLSECEHHK